MSNKLSGLTWDQKTGKGKIDKRVNGQRIQLRFTASTRADAEAQFFRAVGAVPEVTPKWARLTFRDAATKYLLEETKPSLDRDAQALEKLDPWIGHLELPAVHQGSLQPYVDAQREKGLRSSTVCRELAVVRRILTLAARRWRDANDRPWLQTVPEIALPDWRDRADPVPLTWEEQGRLLRALPAHLAEMALFGLNTGCRESLICSLRWEWELKVPELNDTIFYVPGTHTKNGTDFVLVLNSVARSIVESRRGQSPTHVFAFKGEPVTRINNSGWRTAWRKAGLPTGDKWRCGPHNLRHTFARRLRLASVPDKTIKALMHHVDNDVTTVYAPVDLREMRDAVEKLLEVQQTTLIRRVK